MSTENEPDIINTKEVCDILKVGRNTMYRLIEEQKLVPLPKNPLKKLEPLRFDRASVIALRDKGE